MNQQPPTPEPGLCLPCRVIRVLDGDTVELQLLGPTLHLRLEDCWAPEVHGDEKPAGLAAKAHLEQLVAAAQQATVLVSFNGSGKVGDHLTLGRVLGRLYLDGAEAAVLQCAAGHATFTKRTKP